jgi:hypothetical protein
MSFTQRRQLAKELNFQRFPFQMKYNLLEIISQKAKPVKKVSRVEHSYSQTILRDENHIV